MKQFILFTFIYNLFVGFLRKMVFSALSKTQGARLCVITPSGTFNFGDKSSNLSATITIHDELAFYWRCVTSWDLGFGTSRFVPARIPISPQRCTPLGAVLNGPISPVGLVSIGSSVRATWPFCHCTKRLCVASLVNQMEFMAFIASFGLFCGS
jgi:hypothetical protein